MSISSLLTRGIRSQRPKASKTAPEQTIPSAGLGQNTKDYRTPPAEAPIASGSRGKKRKRGGAIDGDSVGVPDQLDFFAGAAKSQHRFVIDKHVQAKAPVEHKIPEGGRAVETAAESTLDKGSCRQILKRNKLKITLLVDKDRAIQDSKSSRKATKSATRKESNTNGQVQLTPRPLLSFEELRSRYRISRRLAENLQAQGFAQPTDVQLGSLPLLLGSDEDKGLPPASSRSTRSRSSIDLLTIAPTGSGKTLAFLVNLIHGLVEDRHARKNNPSGERDPGVQALVVTPTHELADQIVNEGKKLASGTGISISALKRGACLHPELLNIRGHKGQQKISIGNDDDQETDEFPTRKTLVKSSILVSTPPLLLSAIIHPSSSEPLPLPHIHYLILDEADLLLSSPFQQTTLNIWSALPFPDLQTSLWSATIGSSIESLTHNYIFRRRQRLGVSHSEQSHHLIRLVVGLKDSAVPNISHNLTYAATEQGKLLALRHLLNPSNSIASTSTNSPSLCPPFLVFTQTIPRAIALHAELKYDVPPEAGGSSRIAVLHSGLSPSLRSEIMTRFRKGDIWIMITTDLLSRGVDFRGLNGVVNYDIPVTAASYVHRAGRTGRQGRQGGVCVTLYTKEDIPYVKNIANIIVTSENTKRISTSFNGSGNGKAASATINAGGSGINQWLLDALPSVSKDTRKQLKKRGVESRRKGFEDREGRKSRISTKSGYERRMEQRRKGVVGGSQKKGWGGSRMGDGYEVEGEGEWGGFED